MGDIVESNLLSDHRRGLDEQKQPCLGTVQHRLGFGHCGGNNPSFTRIETSLTDTSFSSVHSWGGAYEYLCSVLFRTHFLGVSFWDYTGIPFNLGGRINLLYWFFLGYRGRSVDQSTVSMCVWLDRKDSKNHRTYPDLVPDRFHVRQYAGVGGGSCKIQSSHCRRTVGSCD